MAPPTLDDLRKRILHRGTETEEKINDRMKVAKAELDLMKEYDYIVINDEVEKASERIRAIISAEHCKKDKLIHKFEKWLKEV